MTTSAGPDLLLRGAASTRELGRRLGAAFPGWGLLALSGQLGAGKTTLVKGLAEGLGVAPPDEVTSPTFLRVIRFDGREEGGRTGPGLVHVDAYRMRSGRELEELGVPEELGRGDLVAVEWPEMVEDALPADHLRLELDHRDEDSRAVRLSTTGPEAAAWLRAADLQGVGEPA